jgi:hypothetical protein
VDDHDTLSFEAYSATRERFLATLRADSELRRLERLWAIPATTDAAAADPDDPSGSLEGRPAG